MNCSRLLLFLGVLRCATAGRTSRGPYGYAKLAKPNLFKTADRTIATAHRRAEEPATYDSEVNSGRLYENLRQLITLVDELRDVGLQHYISLPRIAVIGTQSSGKSSLIESIVGLDFLPRGSGVVTRRPLELRLVHLNTQEYRPNTAWATFEKYGDRKFMNFDEVREEIQRQTDEVAGKNKGIVNNPIVLTIYATGAPDLTFIDLPGITRVPLKGSDQVEDIEKLTRKMSLDYVQDARTLLLAVIPANQDMSTSDALQMARQVDPKGLRSIGVITKIDSMDAGTDACKMLLGEDILLRLGYVGVKMRSQQDIDNRVNVRDALDAEKAYLENHRTYSKLPPGLVGTQVLIDKLTQELFKQIRRFLPDIKKEINEKRRSVQDRLDELGEGVPLAETAQAKLLWTLITDYCEMFKNSIRGKYDRKLQRYMANFANADSTLTGAIFGGSHLRSILNGFLTDFFESDMTSEITDDEIDRAFRIHEGDSLSGFPSPDAFEFLALPHLQKMFAPSVECVQNIASALNMLAQRMALAVFDRFPKVAELVLDMTQKIIVREKEATRLFVEQQVACNTGYLFTNDPTYLIEHGSMLSMHPHQDKTASVHPQQDKTASVFNEAVEGGRTVFRNMHTGVNSLIGRQQDAAKKQQRYSGPFIKEIRKRLDAYFAITVRNMRDSIPKAIGFYLIRAVQDKLQFELLQTLKTPQNISEILGESPHINEERRVLMKQLEVLHSADGVLTRDPTLAAMALEAEEERVAVVPTPSPGARGSTGHGGRPRVAATAAGAALPFDQVNSQPAVLEPLGGLGATSDAIAGGGGLFDARPKRKSTAPKIPFSDSLFVDESVL